MNDFCRTILKLPSWKLLGLVLMCGVHLNLLAAEMQLLVNVNDAVVRSGPLNTAPEVTRVKKGKVLTCDGVRKNGFFKLQTKSKKPMWISDLQVDVYHPEDDLIAGKSDQVKKSEETEDGAKFKRWSVDLGASTGASNGASYFEINLGVNYFIYKWLIFRNAPFYRSQSGADSVFGLDSSIDGILGFDLGSAAKAQLMAGAGYRIRNQGTSAPFVESGVGVAVGPLVLDLGVKSIFNSLIDKASSNELLFTIKATGGVSF